MTTEFTISTGDTLVTESGRVEVTDIREDSEGVEQVHLRPVGTTKRVVMSRDDLRRAFENGDVRAVTKGE